MTPSTMPARIASVRARSPCQLAHPGRQFADDVVERPGDDPQLVAPVVPEPGRTGRPPRIAARRRRARSAGARAWRTIAARTAAATSARPSAARVARRMAATWSRPRSGAGPGARRRRTGGLPARRRRACRCRVWRYGAGPPPVRTRAATTSGRVAWFSRPAKVGRVHHRVAEDAPVGRDERHPRQQRPAEPVGLCIEQVRRRVAWHAVRGCRPPAAPRPRAIAWMRCVGLAGQPERHDRRRQQQAPRSRRPTVARNNLLRKPSCSAKHHAPTRLAFSIAATGVRELVAELLDGDERGHEQGEFFPQAPDVHVHRPRAARVLVAPDLGQQPVARQHAAPVAASGTRAAGTPSRSASPRGRRLPPGGARGPA